MAAPVWKQVEKLFHEVLALDPSRRSGFLDTECAGDAALRAAVEDLLRHDNTASFTDTFLASPVAEAAGQLRAELPTEADHQKGFASPAPPAIAGYEILGELGRGGMGVVYKARQTSLNRVVALKMLLPESAAAPELFARFRSEAEVLARLQHPHIIAIYDIGMCQEGPYFSMEYVAGPSLAKVLDGRPQDIAASARLLEILARTMDAVHKQGIVHRDLKPANILLGPRLEERGEGKASAGAPADRAATPTSLASCLSTLTPFVTDFGLAKDQTTAKKLTQSGAVMGTLCYMAPEQAQGSGRAVGPATDLFALGTMLYEMLTGRLPFDAPSPTETIAQLLHEEPLSPARLRPQLPRDLATICLKCLEKAPHKRYASALELAEDLRRFQAGEPIHARPVSFVERVARWCRRRPVVAALLVVVGLLLLALGITVAVYDTRLENALAKAETKAEQERRQIVQLNVTLGMVEMERGKTFDAVLRFTEALRLEEGSAEQDLGHRARIAAALRQCPRLVHLQALERKVVFAQLGPEGGWLATAGSDERQLEVLDAFTGHAAGPPLGLPEPVSAGAISPDGRFLATISTTGKAILWDLKRGTSEALPDRGHAAVTHPAFHPDGRILVTQHADAAVRLWDLTTRPLAPPRPLAGDALALAALSDDARWLFTLNRGWMGQVWDVATGRALGKPVLVGQGAAVAAVSPGGGRLALVGMDKTLRLWDVGAAKWIGMPIRLREMASHVIFSPDGQRVLTFGGPTGIEVWDVRQGDSVTMGIERATAIMQAGFGPGGRLVITTNRAGSGRVWVAATGQALTPPLRHGGPLAAAAIGAGGKEVATVSRGGTVTRWVLPDMIEDKKDLSLRPDMRPIDELIALAQVLAGACIDERQEWQALDSESLRGAWVRLQASKRAQARLFMN